MRAKRTVVCVAVAALVVTSGCVGFLTGSESLAFEASPATVSDGALSETGYEEVDVADQTVNESFTVAEQERTVTVTNWLARYERSVDAGPLGDRSVAAFVVLSTPKVEVLGRTFNPVGDMSDRDLLEQLQSRYGSVEVGDEVGARNVTALGVETRVTRFEGTATLDGTSVDVYVHVTTFEHGGDHLVAVAVHPRQLDGEDENVYALLRGLEHAG